ncbi:MAG: hypothetical protein LBJ42_02450 [Holosporales bacterium]|nr:hypothetical protein [Holosporales bacterium]
MTRFSDSGIIIHGADRNAVRNSAYDLIVQYVHSDESKLSITEVERHVLANTYPNFLGIKKADGKAEISVDDARSVIEFMLQTRCVPGRMAALIEGAENMSRHAANALLKIIEEPRSDSMIILTTTKLFAIIPTIRSRCLKIAERSPRSLSSFSDPKEYVKSALPRADNDLVESAVSFLKSGGRDIIEFAKRNAEYLTDLIDILSALCAFTCIKTCDIDIAEVTLKLHTFARMANRTSPDKQSAIISAYGILTGIDIDG